MVRNEPKESTRTTVLDRGASEGDTTTVVTASQLTLGAVVANLVKRAARAGYAGGASVWSWLAATVRPIGWLLIAVAMLGAAAWWTFGMVEAAVLAAFSIVLLLLGIPFLLFTEGVDVTLELDRDRVVAGSEVMAQLRIRNRGSRIIAPRSVDIPVGNGLVEAEIPMLGGNSEHTTALVISAAKRGVIAVGPMTVARGDPVGILRREASWPQVEKILVHPRTMPIPATSAGTVRDVEGIATPRIVDEGLEFHGFREYVPGDSLRHVHWKATAKADRLMVRQYEETRRATVAVLLDLHETEYPTVPDFELAVSVAASLAAQGIRDGRQVEFVIPAGSQDVGMRRAESIRTLPNHDRTAMLDACCELEMRADVQRLEEVSRMATDLLPDMTLAFLVTGSQISAERVRRAAFALPLGARAAVVCCRADAEPTVRTAAGVTLITVGRLGDLGRLVARGALA